MPNDNASLFRAASAWRAVEAQYVSELPPGSPVYGAISPELREALNVWADDVVAARCKAGRDGCRPQPEIF